MQPETPVPFHSRDQMDIRPPHFVWLSGGAPLSGINRGRSCLTIFQILSSAFIDGKRTVFCLAPCGIIAFCNRTLPMAGKMSRPRTIGQRRPEGQN